MDIGIQMTQTQTLSHRMIQSAEILQMHASELRDYLYELSLENPTVDIKEASSATDFSLMEKYQWLTGQDSAAYDRPASDMDDGDGEADRWNFDVQRGETLQEYLWSQIVSSDLTVQESGAIKYMLECLDDKGYFTEDLSLVARQFGLGPEQADSLLSRLQGLEPAGICARSLPECLILQLERFKLDTPLLRGIIRDHLDLVAKNQLPQIAKKLDIPLKEVADACQAIRSLNPKPGVSFCDRSRLKYIIPDVTVVKFKEHFDILLNDSLYPDIEVNPYYRQISKSSDPEVREYLMKKISQTEWVRQCIAQRNQTLLQVAKALVTRQDQFFLHGLPHLKPLRLLDVAGDLDVHESTVSRAVRNKYLQCAWGIFPMNFLFSKGIAAKGDAGRVTAQDIKKAIRDVIGREDPQKPFSDRVLAEELEKQGITISRRTVAKYREQELIPDASGRKAF